jgi:hypothetical protein
MIKCKVVIILVIGATGFYAKEHPYIHTCNYSVMLYTEDYMNSKLLKELEGTHVVSNCS